MPDAAGPRPVTPRDTPVLQVALPLPLPRLFDYAPATDDVSAAAVIGCRVRVPFGPRELIGVVVGVGPAAPDAPEVRTAIAMLDREPLLQGELLASLRWLARYTHASLGEVLATALPAALRRGEPLPDTLEQAWQPTAAAREALPHMRPGAPRRLLDALLHATRSATQLDEELPGWRPAARTLAQRALAECIAQPASTIPGAVPADAPEPNEAQRHAISAVLAASAGFAPLLLDGVTGSGKTEVYLRTIADCLARGRQALVLVPEIGLTPQMLARFRARLGVPVHALHSGRNDTERARVWTAAWRGEARVIVGTRSAVFTPLPRAGLIVVDEEHDASYKQQDGIRYHARDLALLRGKALGIPVLLGSATPSLETLHNARNGRFAHLHLRHRAGDAQPPAVRMLDVRKRPLQAGLSPQLIDAIDAALAQGGQVLVFKNRRGYAPVLLCHDCGWNAQCRHCATASQGMAMTVHGGGRRLQCHHCGVRRAVPQACPDCGGLALQPQGAGTERIEAMLAERFAQVPVLRVDRGSTRRRDALDAVLTTLGAHPGILVGTQMLAKGHDLPNLTLVAVVGIDEGLFSADFRASEKLAQLLIQVAGRAGRAGRRGAVLLQTHHPQHPLLHTLLEGGYPAFAEAELALREVAAFPPFAHLALLRAEAKSIDAAQAFLAAADALLGAAAGDGVQRHGPLPAPMPRRAGFQRLQLLLAAAGRKPLHALLDAVVPALYALPQARKVRWSLDVDPIDLY